MEMNEEETIEMDFNSISGIGLSFLHETKERIKMIDCLDLTTRYFFFYNFQKFYMFFFSFHFFYGFIVFFGISTSIEQKAKDICANEVLLCEEYLPELEISLRKLQKRLHLPVKSKFYHFKTLKSNLFPLTNVAFNKEGSR